MTILFIHILISTATMCVLCVAALLAILLALQERALRRKRFQGIVTVLPPLESMERFLFQVVTLGFVLLSGVLLTSLFLYREGLVQNILEKSSLSLLSWGVFATLLIGRVRFGWRGPAALNWTLIGVGLTFLLYACHYTLRSF